MNRYRAKYSQVKRVAIFLGALLLCACGNTRQSTTSVDPLTLASDITRPPSSLAMQTGAPAPAPYGHVEFCQRQPDECRNSLAQDKKDETAPKQLSKKAWADLLAVNNAVNGAIHPVTDRALYDRLEYWTYPSHSGDCEDYALLKRRRLMERGWAGENLLLSVAIEADGNAHAVLIVTTDQGDYVLDNQSSQILPWMMTPYSWDKRQSAYHPAIWLSLEQQDQPLIATSTTKRRRP